MKTQICFVKLLPPLLPTSLPLTLISPDPQMCIRDRDTCFPAPKKQLPYLAPGFLPKVAPPH